MIYDLKNETEQKLFLSKVQWLIAKEKKVELTEKREKRTLSQNSYLHLILSWFCIESGNQLEFVKREYFKKLVNADIFIVEKDDPYLGRVQVLRSSSCVNTKELAEAVDRFRDWSSKEAGIYLPEANEDSFISHIRNEIEKQKRWI